MSKGLRRFVIALACSGLILVLCAPASAAGIRLPPALSSLQSCLETSHRLLVLDLIDESGSLMNTDPANERVAGVKAELAGLARLAGTPIDGRRIDVEVRIASFATAYRAVWQESSTHPTWRSVSQAALASLLISANALASRNRGQDTDYVTALRHAQADLLARSAALTQHGGAPPCKAIVWFTDGRYDVAPRTTATAGRGLTVPYAPGIPITSAQAEQRVLSVGDRLMCQTGGLLDQLRGDQVKMLVVALDQELTPGASNFLRGAADGAGPNPCGSHGGPETGLYLLASQESQLLFMFASLFDVPAPIRFCPTPGQSACSFSTVAGLSSFSLDIATPPNADKVTLRGPSGAVVQLSPGVPSDTTFSGAHVSAQWFSPQALEIDGQLPDATSTWVGRWQLEFVDSNGAATGPGSYTLRLRANLLPAIFGSPRATVGRQSRVSLGFVDAAGRPVYDSPLLRGAALEAALFNLDSGSQLSLGVQSAGPGRWTTTFTPSGAGGRLPRLALALAAVLAPTAGVTITTQPRQVQLEIIPPPSFPSVQQHDLELPSVRGRASTSGTVTVLGPAYGSGCFAVSASAVALPQQSNLGHPAVSPGANGACVHIAAGETRTVRVDVHPSAAGSGRAGGELTFELVSSAGGRLRSVVPYGFDMVPPPDITHAILLFAGLLALGIMIPLSLLAFLNWLGARFADPQLVRYVVRNVELTPAGLTSPGASRRGTGFQAGDPVDVDPIAFERVVNDRRVNPKREFELDGGRFRFSGRALGRRGERFPSFVRGPYGVVEASSGAPVAGSGGTHLLRFASTGRHEVPLALAGSWIFDRDLDGLGVEMSEPWTHVDDESVPRPLRGRLLILVPSSLPHEGSAVLLDADAELRQLYETLIKEAAPPPADPSRPRAWTRPLGRRDNGPTAQTTPASPEPDDNELFRTR